MKFYEYSQNNSGGSFDRDMGYQVYIEAESSDKANAIAEDIGIYFDGCENDLDCPCCGDRWYRAGEHSAIDAEDLMDNIDAVEGYASFWGLYQAVYYADGRVEKHGGQEQ